MTDRIESMQIDVDEIRRNRAAIAELVGALRDAVNMVEYLHRKFQETGSGNGFIAQWNHIIAKYNHIVDANKMVPPALYLCTKCGGANYGCGCDSFKHCTVPLYTNQTEKE